jgi:CHAT domain-containing protein
MAGFAQTLLMTGGQSALLGLWSVNTITTKALMEDFYHRWQNGQTKASALRQAILALRDGQLLPPGNGLDLSDAYYWAPFALYGNWI